ncbi:MAG: peptidoglycan-binding protein [Phycisphaerales bacterium]|nr:peptidoglycan-binding protein [Phycisphaerales bacterium]
MPIDHVVRHGECLLSISDRYGFFPETLWNHADNRQLKQQREDPNVLQAGDVVHIPDLNRKEESKPDKQRHRFRRKGVPGKLRIRLLDNGQPRAHVPYRLVIDGHIIEAQTDGDGFVEQDLPASASQGELIVDRDDGGTDHYHFNFGTVDPIDTEAGQRHRLHDLGYDTTEHPEAIRAFQRDHDLEPSGQADDQTLSKLQEIFGQ